MDLVTNVSKPIGQVGMSTLDDVAASLAKADYAPVVVTWDELTEAEQARYRVMASAAISVLVSAGVVGDIAGVISAG